MNHMFEKLTVNVKTASNHVRLVLFQRKDTNISIISIRKEIIKSVFVLINVGSLSLHTLMSEHAVTYLKQSMNHTSNLIR